MATIYLYQDGKPNQDNINFVYSTLFKNNNKKIQKFTTLCECTKEYVNDVIYISNMNEINFIAHDMQNPIIRWKIT